MISVVVIAFALILEGVSFGQTIVITEKRGNIRTGPGTTYSIITSVAEGEQYSIIEQSNDWYKVRLEDGRGG
jgi:uncharacterized protein YgiM (DUF1202 family)